MKKELLHRYLILEETENEIKTLQEFKLYDGIKLLEIWEPKNRYIIYGEKKK